MNPLNDILSGMGYSDWFVLKKLNANINSIRFGELCEGIKIELKSKSPGGRLSSSPLPAYTDSDKSYKDTDEYGEEVAVAFLNNKDNLQNNHLPWSKLQTGMYNL